MRRRLSRTGMTLVELMIGSALLVGGGGALLLGMHYALLHTDYLSQYQAAMNAAAGRLEALAATPFDTLWSGPEFANAWRDPAIGPSGQTEAIANLPGARLTIQIRSADSRTPANPSLLDLHVAVTWSMQRRLIGEDRNANGILDLGEDANNNGWMDSVAMVSTRIARRD